MTVNVQEAILAFSQSEKIKSGIIWISQAAEMLPGLGTSDRFGAEKVIAAMLDMILNETRLARKLVSEETWLEAEKHLDLAAVMLNSGVPYEVSHHLTGALTRVTTIGQRSMGYLKNEGLL